MALNDVQNFAVDNDCLFTWDPVTDATGYELRIGSTWENSAPLVNVTISGTSYQYMQVLDADTVLIKATAQGFEDSLNASTVTTPAAPIIADVQNLAIVADELTFDAVPDATGYEIRFAKGFQSDAVDSLILATPSNNDPLSVPNSAGFRFFVRALGPCNTKSSVYSELWEPFDTSGDCSPADSSTDFGFLFDIENVGTGLQLYKGKNAQLIGQLLTLIAGTNITLDETPAGIVINSTGGGVGASSLNDLTDVELQNLLDGQILQYDAAEGKFLNVDPTPASAPTWTPSTISSPFAISVNSQNTNILPVSNGVELTPTDGSQSGFVSFFNDSINIGTTTKKGFYFKVDSLPTVSVEFDQLSVVAFDDQTAPTFGVSVLTLEKTASNSWNLIDPLNSSTLATFTVGQILSANICVAISSSDGGLNLTFDYYVRNTVGTTPDASFSGSAGVVFPPAFLGLSLFQDGSIAGAQFTQYTTPPFEYSGVEIISSGSSIDPASYPTPRANTSFIITGLSTYPATVASVLGEVYDGVTFTFDGDGNPVARTIRELNQTWTPQTLPIPLIFSSDISFSGGPSDFQNINEGVTITPENASQESFASGGGLTFETFSQSFQGLYFSVDSLPSFASNDNYEIRLDFYNDLSSPTQGRTLLRLKRKTDGSGDFELLNPDSFTPGVLATYTEVEILNANICVSFVNDNNANDIELNYYIRNSVGTVPDVVSSYSAFYGFTQSYIVLNASRNDGSVDSIAGAQFTQYTTPPFEYSGVEIISSGSSIDPASYPTPRANRSIIITGLSTYPATVGSVLGEVYDGVTFTFDGDGNPVARTVREPGTTDKFKNLPTFADDAAAGSGGLSADSIYKTPTGELRVKL